MPDETMPDLPLLILALVAQSRNTTAALLSLSSAAESVADMAMAMDRLAEEPRARLVLLCTRPETWVALALAEGRMPSQAVGAWRDMLRGVLVELRKRRRRVTVLFDHSLAAAPAACAAALGLDWGTRPVPVLPAADPVLSLLARDALLRDPAAGALASELEATAFVPEGFEPFFDADPDQIFAAHRSGMQQLSEAEAAAKAATQGLQARLQALQADHGALQAQLGASEARVGAATEALRAAEAARAALTEASATEIARLQAELVASESRLDSLVRSSARREVQLVESAAQAAEAAVARARETAEREAAAALAKAEIRLREARTEATVAAQAAQAEAGLLRDQIRLQDSALQDTRSALALQLGKLAEAEAAQERQQVLAERQSAAAEKRLSQTQEAAESVIRQLRDQLYQMGQGLESYHAQLEALQIERQELLAQVRQLHEIREELEGYFDRARQLSGQVESLGSDVTQLQGALSDRTQQAQWLQDEIQRIYRTRSYRLTAPLRKVRVALKGVW